MDQTAAIILIVVLALILLSLLALLMTRPRQMRAHRPRGGRPAARVRWRRRRDTTT